ncbi:MAG: monovalent cation/H(+) antiporter subunit G [Lachnospiraceae bacterium]|nr:monovalent cation/H(+) antiporter subunit G [Lachnospiraceae bacterium]MBR5584316.1 monovalent cation/H(+) antiporter subunit G [Lachnospiraceae bacterium]
MKKRRRENKMIRFLLAAIFLLGGLFFMASAVLGMFRFKFVLNRMHTAASADTFGLLLSMIGLIIWKGFGFEALKMMIIIGFFWISGPVSSHLIARMEVSTNENLEEECEVREYGEL